MGKPAARPWHDAILEIERVWLGLSRPPIDVRLADAGWSPESHHAACWRCGSSVGPAEADDTGCPTCRTTQVQWDRFVRLGTYEGVLREMIQEVKFTRWRRLGHELGLRLGHAVEGQIDRLGIDRTRVSVTPVPMSLWRRLHRGVDHATVIARGVAQALDAPLLHTLGRRHRPPQWRVPPRERARNVADSFWRREGHDLQGRLVVLVDDVATTRATLRAACRALIASPTPQSRPRSAKDRGFLLWTAVVAVTPPPNRRPASDRPSNDREDSGRDHGGKTPGV